MVLLLDEIADVKSIVKRFLDGKDLFEVCKQQLDAYLDAPHMDADLDAVTWRMVLTIRKMMMTTRAALTLSLDYRSIHQPGFPSVLLPSKT